MGAQHLLRAALAADARVRVVGNGPLHLRFSIWFFFFFFFGGGGGGWVGGAQVHVLRRVVVNENERARACRCVVLMVLVGGCCHANLC